MAVASAWLPALAGQMALMEDTQEQPCMGQFKISGSRGQRLLRFYIASCLQSPRFVIDSTCDIMQKPPLTKGPLGWFLILQQHQIRSASRWSASSASPSYSVWWFPKHSILTVWFNTMWRGDLQVLLLYEIKIYCAGYISSFYVLALLAKQPESTKWKMPCVVLATLICRWGMYKLMHIILYYLNA